MSAVGSFRLTSGWVRFLQGTAALASVLAFSTPGAGQGLPVAQPAEIGLSSAALDRIAPAMQTYIDSGRVAGMVMMIARRGKIGYMQALGYSDLENRIALRTDA